MRFLLLCVWAATYVSAGDQIIHAGKLFDGTSDTLREQVTITVKDNRIHAVQDGFVPAGPGQELIDLSQYCVLPGLMDMHTHLSTKLGPKAYMERIQFNPSDLVLRAAHHGEITLMAGFTTVREVGASDYVDISLKRAIERGWVIGPRIFGAGPSIATTGGHADPSNGLKHALMGDHGPSDNVINSAEDARKAIRTHYKKGADLIKITATGGVLSVAKNGQNPQFTQDELKALVETAKDYGMMVAAHAHGAEGIKRAVVAGVTTIEHGSYLDDEGLELMKKHGTYLVPTLSAGWFVTQEEVLKTLPPVVAKKAREIGPVLRSNFAKVVSRGVKVAFGTDAGVSPHGKNGYEFVLMVEAGMKPVDALKSATSVTAKLLDMTDSLGSISKGKLADIVAVKDDPLQNIETMTDVIFVMKDGVVYKQPN